MQLTGGLEGSFGRVAVLHVEFVQDAARVDALRDRYKTGEIWPMNVETEKLADESEVVESKAFAEFESDVVDFASCFGENKNVVNVNCQ